MQATCCCSKSACCEKQRLVQACAKQVLGQIKVTFPESFNTGWCKQIWGFLFHPSYAYYWNPDNGKKQWWIDALSVDPSKSFDDLRGIWARGVPQPVVESKVHNSSIGSMPLILAYVAVHPDYGCHIFFPFHGAKHGGVDKLSHGTMYQGFRFWFHDCGPLELHKLTTMNYYNTEEAMVKAADRLAKNPGSSQLSKSSKAKKSQLKAKRSNPGALSQAPVGQQSQGDLAGGSSSQQEAFTLEMLTQLPDTLDDNSAGPSSGAQHDEAGPSSSALGAAGSSAQAEQTEQAAINQIERDEYNFRLQQGVDGLQMPLPDFDPWAFLVRSQLGCHAMLCSNATSLLGSSFTNFIMSDITLTHVFSGQLLDLAILSLGSTGTGLGSGSWVAA